MEKMRFYLVVANELELQVRSPFRSWRRCGREWPAWSSCRCRLARAPRMWRRSSSLVHSKSVWNARVRSPTTTTTTAVEISGRWCQPPLLVGFLFGFVSRPSILWLDPSLGLLAAPNTNVRCYRSFRFIKFSLIKLIYNIIIGLDLKSCL